MNKVFYKEDIPVQDNPKEITFGSLFCGAGAPILGAQWAGLKVKWGIEPREYFNIRTFRLNFNDILYSEEMESFSHQPVDILWGSPSCGEFSSALRSSKNQINVSTKAFEEFEYVKFMMEIKRRKPKIFILENIPSVRNFVSFVAEPAGYVLKHRMTKQRIELYDYHIEEHNITPTEVEFPQKRNRLFTIGSLFPHKFLLLPPEKNYVEELSVREIFNGLDKMRETGKQLFNDELPTHSEDKVERMTRILPGEGLYGGQNNMRMDPDKCSNVVMGKGSNFIHPWKDRLLTNRENACLMGYPLDHKFYGSVNNVKDQVGKGIVPFVGQYILIQAREYLEKI